MAIPAVAKATNVDHSSTGAAAGPRWGARSLLDAVRRDQHRIMRNAQCLRDVAARGWQDR